jgi:tRNA(Arg) A34 adenosine deaminase TadA
MTLTITLPSWVDALAAPGTVCVGDEAKMRLAIALARENVLRDTGGPFGSAIFERGTGRLVAVGVNSVVRLNNSVLHAESVAIMLAEAKLGKWSLAEPEHELFTSCAPCAMCLGATLWSGVKRLVIAASKEDAEALDFDEGPVFAESYAHLARRGVEIEADVLRSEAQEVFALYKARGGEIYNG